MYYELTNKILKRIVKIAKECYVHRRVFSMIARNLEKAADNAKILTPNSNNQELKNIFENFRY